MTTEEAYKFRRNNLAQRPENKWGGGGCIIRLFSFPISLFSCMHDFKGRRNVMMLSSARHAVTFVGGSGWQCFSLVLAPEKLDRLYLTGRHYANSSGGVVGCRLHLFHQSSCRKSSLIAGPKTKLASRISPTSSYTDVLNKRQLSGVKKRKKKGWRVGGREKRDWQAREGSVAITTYVICEDVCDVFIFIF